MEYTQRELVLNHLKGFISTGITPLEALKEYGCMRLGSVICDLRKRGYRIKTTYEFNISRFTGRKIKYARYTLESNNRIN